MKRNGIFSSIFRYIKEMDRVLWLIIAFISVFSLILLSSVSRATQTDYYSTQLFAIIMGVLVAVIIPLFDYYKLSNHWKLIAIISVALMIYTRLFGINISGAGGVNATAWITVFGRTFQPSELVKIAFIITFAKHIHILKEEGVLNQPLKVMGLALHAFVPFGLCAWQDDIGAGLVFFFMFIFMSISAGISFRYFAILGIVILLLLPIVWQFGLAEYQLDRFTAVYNLDDPSVILEEGYQQYQGRLSIGSGGFTGQGLFEGPRVESNIVTFQHSDFIFSVVGEELGFIGCTVVILSLLALLLRLLYISSKAKDDMGRVMCFGFFGLIAIQTIFNIGMTLALLPVVGLTLPFYSAGGSSAMCLYFGIGLVQAVYMQRKRLGKVVIKQRHTHKLSYKDFNIIGN